MDSKFFTAQVYLRWRCDANGLMVWSSHPAIQTGSDFPACFLGQVHPDDRERYLETSGRVLENQAPYTIEYRFSVNSAHFEMARESALPVYEADGVFSGFTGITTPVATFNHPRSQEIRHSEERLRIILDNLPALISYVSPQHFFVYNNKAYESYLRLPLEQIQGRHMREVLGPEAYQARLPFLERAYSGELVAFEMATPHPEGLRYTAVSYVPDRGTDGIKGVVCLINDITSLKKAEATTRASEERYRIALDVGGIGTWQWDNSSGKSSASRRLGEICGIGGKGFPTRVRDLKRFFPAGSARNSLRQIIDSLRGRNPQCEFKIITGDGQERWVSASSKRFLREDGHHLTTLFAVVDITSQKEAMLLREIQFNRQSEARSAAEYANKMKDEFLATLSHELRTPLNAILGWSQLLLRTLPSGDRLKEGLEKIQRQALMQAQLVSDLLDMSGIISGKLSLEKKELDLRDVVTAAVDTVMPSAEAKQITMDVQIGTEKQAINGDWRRLQQIIWNLLSNSIKFSPPGKKIQVTLYKRDNKVFLHISDEGIGITADFLPYMFDRFRQADATSTRKVGGLGIGLALSKQLVENHSGTITASSQGEGKGADFLLTFPLVEFDSEISEVKKTRLNSSLTGTRILIVEDEDDARESLKKHFTEAGAVTQAVSSAVDALAMMGTFQASVLVSDISLPGFDGFELIKEIRRREASSGRKLPAVALTALAKEENIAKCLNYGFQKHHAKPVDIEELFKTVTELLLDVDERLTGNT